MYFNFIFASLSVQSSSKNNIFPNQIFEDAGGGREKGLELRSVCIGHKEYSVLEEVQMKILNIFVSSSVGVFCFCVFLFLLYFG